MSDVTRDGYIFCIGAANLDIHGFSSQPLLARESNPGAVHRSAGGVSRNIAENLVRLGHRVKLVTTFGDDLAGRYLHDRCTQLGIDTSHALTVEDIPTSTYISLNDPDGDMALAVSDMRVLDALSRAHLESISDQIDGARAVVIDAGLPPDCIEYLAERYAGRRGGSYGASGGGPAVFVNPVSVKKCVRMHQYTGHFFGACMNRTEAATLSGIPIDSHSDIPRAATALHQAGIAQVFITSGVEGAWYCDGLKEGHLVAPAVQLRNATGAGDAFTAGVVHAYMSGRNIREAARTGLAVASLALESSDTVSADVRSATVESRLQGLVARD